MQFYIDVAYTGSVLDGKNEQDVTLKKEDKRGKAADTFIYIYIHVIVGILISILY